MMIKGNGPLRDRKWYCSWRKAIIITHRNRWEGCRWSSH